MPQAGSALRFRHCGAPKPQRRIRSRRRRALGCLSFPGTEAVRVASGTRIAQLVFQQVEQVELLDAVHSLTARTSGRLRLRRGLSNPIRGWGPGVRLQAERELAGSGPRVILHGAVQRRGRAAVQLLVRRRTTMP